MNRCTTHVALAGHPVEVTYEIEPAEYGYPEQMYVCEILINDKWLDVVDVLAPWVIDDLNDQLPKALQADTDSIRIWMEAA